MKSSATRIRLFLLATLTILGAQSVNAFPTGGGGCLFCSPYSLGGSIITFDLTSNDENGLAPVTFNFIKDLTQDPSNPEGTATGKLCLSGKIRATIVDGAATGEATYELLGADGSNRGVCYEKVTQVCEDLSADVGACHADKCTYKSDVLDASNVAELLDGRFKVDTSLPVTGPYAVCTDGDVASPDTEICNFEVGFGFNGTTPIPTDFFPATTTLNEDTVDANVVLYANEICIECNPQTLGLTAGTIALESKSNVMRHCEAIAIKTDWCNDLQSWSWQDPPVDSPEGTLATYVSAGPNCIGDSSNPPIGHMNIAMGDFQIQDSTTICISDLEGLKTLPSCDSKTAIAACSGGPGYITYPEKYETIKCDPSDPIAESEIFAFSSAEGGGSSTTNIAAIGANPDAPGYVGDNTIPEILPGWTAIISTPDNQVNIWDFSESAMYRVAFTHVRNSDDEVTGSKDDDTILGGSGADWLYGYDGNDILQGGDNTDKLIGGDGDDLLLGYECTGPNANCSSFLNKGSEDDMLIGDGDVDGDGVVDVRGDGNGDDCLDGGRGNDILIGGGGSDAFVLFGTIGNDTIRDYSSDEDDVIVDLTGNAEIRWIPNNKDEALSVCKVLTGGKNAVTIEGIIEEDDCDASVITVLDVLGGTALPSQCTGHPYSFY